MSTFIDAHCHLDDCKDIPGCVERARENNVGIIVTQGTNHESNLEALKLAEKYKEVKPALGLYPIEALSMTDIEIKKELDFIRDNKKKIAAIGEVGIDFKGMEPSFQTSLEDKNRQLKIFEDVVHLSMELDKPLIIHSRKAELECVELLERLKARKVIMHCFCGSKKLVDRIVNNGWYLTIPTNVTRLQQFQENARDVPIEQLFCETDSPFLHPDKMPDNEPANVIRSYEWIAKMKNLDLESVKDKIYSNYKKLFNF